MNQLKAPFPYYGGKSRWAAEVWQRLGDVTVYVEPFAGSLAVLLAGPEHQREIVCDTNGFICNFWRAIAADPHAVAAHADYPTIHQDLTARHGWLMRWGAEHAEHLSEDAEWYDARAAGWWAWGMSNWIGGGFCSGTAGDQIPNVNNWPGGAGVQPQRINLPDQIPHMAINPGGRGVQPQRINLPDQIPYVAHNPGGQGVQPQRESMPDQIPRVKNKPGGEGVQVQRLSQPDKRPTVMHKPGGQGVQVQRLSQPDRIPHVNLKPGGQGVNAQRIELAGTDIGSGARLAPSFVALAQRLARVVVLNRSWESALTLTLLMHTPSSPKPAVGIFLDPPFRTDTGRGANLYNSDIDGSSDDAAHGSYLWAVEHGEVYRIAYACHENDFPLPFGWTAATPKSFKGHHGGDRVGTRDIIYYSPACNRSKTQGMLELA